MITHYQHLSDDEFLRILQDKLGHSPILDELYNRFMSINDSTLTKCPICEAPLDDIPF
jgi:hypothetical protein